MLGELSLGRVEGGGCDITYRYNVLGTSHLGEIAGTAASDADHGDAKSVIEVLGAEKCWGEETARRGSGHGTDETTPRKGESLG